MSVAKAVTIAAKGLSFDIVRQSGLFPTIGILNSFFQCGVDDVGSDVTMHWEPFTLRPAEYDEFVELCRVTVGEFAVDGLGLEDYASWFAAVSKRGPRTR